MRPRRPLPTPDANDRIDGAQEILRRAKEHLVALRGTPVAATNPAAIPRALSRVANAEKRLRAAIAERDALATNTRTINAPN